jgi:hypothetical protein
VLWKYRSSSVHGVLQDLCLPLGKEPVPVLGRFCPNFICFWCVRWGREFQAMGFLTLGFCLHEVVD